MTTESAELIQSIQGREGWSVPAELLELGNRLGIDVIFDVGSRDGLEGRFLARELNARELHTFEPVPLLARICRQNLIETPQKFKAVVNETVVSDRTGEVTFYPIDMEKSVTMVPGGNPGASSLFRVNEAYPYEQLVQYELTRPSITLDDYCRDNPVPDLLWMDTQGSEVLIFEGARGILPQVKIVFTEVCFKPVYHGQSLYWDIDAFLTEAGFRRVQVYFGKAGPKKRLRRWLTQRRFAQHIPGRFWSKAPWYSEAMYVNARL